ncbi:MAG: hypothetical protein B9S32_06030 [Verrucomicrobia bacterium Tous-C9LFEB]|nr:MAG: hypothetical protein B9S32_06030 [Verrucomicrobia bacterium Tous-C9LFEB]
MDIPRLDPTAISRIDVNRAVSQPIPVKAAQWEQALNAQRLKANVPARLNLAEAVIRQEKQTLAEESTPPTLAYSYSARLPVPEPVIATTAAPTPPVLEKPATPVTPAKAATTAPAVTTTASAPPAEPTTALASAAATETLLPLNEITQQQGLLQRADIHFDATTNRWSAEWPSPRPFHYGMVLKPTLAQFIKDGQSFAFQTGTDQAQTIRNKGGEIVVSNKTGNETVLDSQGLRHLLTNKIKSNGFELYLTQTGSLVLATTGNLARSMALAH